ncbi:MAG: shikimate dehydrogenase [Pseudomonadaceae bacterium]|nr:shikimate dehydrogenase [Pseudomonadaceae bacterium]
MQTTEINRYLVVGNPIAHSRSPQIHNAFAKQLGDKIIYDKAEVETGEFSQFAEQFKSSGGKGMNVTVPFKIDAYNYVDTVDEHARAASAVNTIKFTSDNQSKGFNTDGIGLLRDLSERHGVDLQGKHVLLIGAGGAAQGALLPLLQAGIRRLTLMNRTVEKAQLLLQQPVFRNAGVELAAQALNMLDEPADLVINATSFGLGNEVMPLQPSLVNDAFCYDMSYGPAARFCRWAAGAGATSSVDGLGMLVEQAAQSYCIWHGQLPRTQPVYELIRRAQPVGAQQSSA